MKTRAPSSRRDFLCSLGAAGCAAALVPTLQGCEFAELHRGPVSSATLDFDVALAPYTTLAKPGGVAVPPADVGGRPLLLIRTNDTTVVALYRKCSHQGFDLSPDEAGQWNQANQQLVCLAHSSAFGPDGKVQHGPAMLPLQSFVVTFEPATGKGSVQT
jgi:Rieske Fe-S protein